MKAKDHAISIVITLILAMFIFLVGAKKETFSDPIEAYQVYLNGNVIGLLDSKSDFLALVDEKQQEIKDKYGVDKVYPPSGLEIEKITTYDDNIQNAEEIYDLIEDTDPFTIEGYLVTIKSTDEDTNPLYINVLNKSDFEDAIYKTVAAFVGTDDLEAYKNNTQEQITDTGTVIESVYWEEEITTKQTYISTKDKIFTDVDELSQYLLYGTTDTQSTYTVQDGDSISDIIEKNHLSLEEFLISNPSIPNANALLTANQQVYVSAANPLITVVSENKVVEDIVNKYETVYQNDNTMYKGQTKTIQTGSNGLNRVTEQIQYVNGQINDLVITNSSEISPATDEIIAKGTMSYSNSDDYTYVNTGSEKWYWPTVSPYVITSYFAWRWGEHHDGLDISGCGFGSPIYSSTDGTVIDINKTCSNYGWYGSTCGGEFGNYVRIRTSDGTYTVIYGHMTKDIKVSIGDIISRGQLIGYMGKSGSATGTHLHFEIDLASTGAAVNPCKVAFSC